MATQTGIATSKVVIPDEPPPLEDMSEVLTRLHLASKDRTCFKDGPAIAHRNVDTTTLSGLDASNKAGNPCLSEPFKRGFLKSKYDEEKAKLNKGKQAMPFLKVTKQPKYAKIKDIPDFLKVKLEDTPREALRKELVGMLEPTKELVKDVMDNEAIKAGLEDPEVMHAVQEIAENPDSMQKYRKNLKVKNFYSQLGTLMGEKIQAQEAKRKPEGP